MLTIVTFYFLEQPHPADATIGSAAISGTEVTIGNAGAIGVVDFVIRLGLLDLGDLTGLLALEEVLLVGLRALEETLRDGDFDDAFVAVFEADADFDVREGDLALTVFRFRGLALSIYYIVISRGVCIYCFFLY